MVAFFAPTWDGNFLPRAKLLAFSRAPSDIDVVFVEWGALENELC